MSVSLIVTFVTGLVIGVLVTAFLNSVLNDGPYQPDPCIGQTWHLRGVGKVCIVGIRVSVRTTSRPSRIEAVKYEWGSRGESWTGESPIGVFLDSATFQQD